MDLEPDGLNEAPLRIIVLEIENTDWEAHAADAIDEHIQRLRLAGAWIARNQDAEIEKPCFGLEGRPVDLAAILVAAKHNRLRGRRLAARRGRRRRRRRFGRLFLDLVFLDDLHIRKLQNVRKR